MNIIKKMTFFTLIVFNYNQCQAQIHKLIWPTIKTTILVSGFIEWYKSDFNIHKVERKIRKFKNESCDTLIANLKKECNPKSEKCNELIKCIERQKSNF